MGRGGLQERCPIDPPGSTARESQVRVRRLVLWSGAFGWESPQEGSARRNSGTGARPEWEPTRRPFLDRNGSSSNPVDTSDSARLRRVQPLPPGQGRDITGRERTPPTHSNEHFLHGTARCARPPSYHRTARCSRELSDILPKRMSPCSPAPSGAMIPTPQNGVKHQMFV